MKTSGWIKLERKIFESEFAPKDRAFTELEAWLWLLCAAKFKGDKRGTVQRSMRNLSKIWGWSIAKTIRFFAELKANSSADHKTDHTKTEIRIINYETYQGVETDRGSRRISKTDHKTDHNIKKNDLKNDLNSILYFSSNVVCDPSGNDDHEIIESPTEAKNLKIVRGAR